MAGQQASSTAPHAPFLPELSCPSLGFVFRERQSLWLKMLRAADLEEALGPWKGWCCLSTCREVGAGGGAAQALPCTCSLPGGALPGFVWVEAPAPGPVFLAGALEDTLARLPGLRRRRTQGRESVLVVGSSGPGCVWYMRRCGS